MKQLNLDHAVNFEEMSLQEIEAYLEKEGELDPVLICKLKADPRKGTTRLAARYIKQREKMEKERERIQTLKSREEKLHQEGYEHIAGVDEVGRGPLAGPVMAASVIMPRESIILGVDDSKKLSASRRAELSKDIRSEAVAVGIGAVDADEIDRVGIVTATGLAMKRALQRMDSLLDYVLIDGGIRIPGLTIPHENVIGGDGKCYTIASASIVAKVERDRIMVELGEKYSDYRFAENKGYGTDEHLKAVERCGYSAAHRKSFRFHDKDQLKMKGL